MAQVDATAAGLLALGVRPGDRVGVWGPSSPEWLLLQFATARVGAIQVNVNPSYRSHELEFALNKVLVPSVPFICFFSQCVRFALDCTEN